MPIKTLFLDRYGFMLLQQLIQGLTIGYVYALIALGYTMVYGILQLINFAHGEIYMLGAYMTIIGFGLFTSFGLTETSIFLSLFLTLIFTILFVSAYGLTVERVAYKPLRSAPRLSPPDQCNRSLHIPAEFCDVNTGSYL
jgi:branched-chain amino acid transport system permease protein